MDGPGPPRQGETGRNAHSDEGLATARVGPGRGAVCAERRRRGGGVGWGSQGGCRDFRGGDERGTIGGRAGGRAGDERGACGGMPPPLDPLDVPPPPLEEDLSIRCHLPTPPNPNPPRLPPSPQTPQPPPRVSCHPPKLPALRERRARSERKRE